MNPHQVTKDFERALCQYTGAPYAVAVNSCTMALLLAVAWHIRDQKTAWSPYTREAGKGEYEETSVSALPPNDGRTWISRRVYPCVEIPKRTYVSVPMSIIHAGGRPMFRDEEWLGAYQLMPLAVWDSARLFTSGMYRGTVQCGRFADGSRGAAEIDRAGQMVCLSFHASKILGDSQGGAILHDNPEADAWLRRARFDGRAEGVSPADDSFNQLGWHCYLSPDVSARLLWQLSVLPRHNEPIPNDPYPDLSQIGIFK